MVASCLRHRVWTITISALLAAGGTASGQAYLPAPPGGKVIVPDVVGQVGGGNGKIDVIDVQGQPFAKAVRMTSDKPGQAWDLAFSIPIPVDIAKGETYLLGYWIRSIRTRHESGQGLASIDVIESDGPWRRVAGAGINFPKEWVHYWVPGVAPADLKKGSVSLKVFAGQESQTLEIGGFEILSYGVGFDPKTLPVTRLTYLGREPDAPWRKAAQERIEKIRMAPLRVKVIGRDGKPVADARVKLEQVSTPFTFGIEFTSGRIVDSSKPENAVYRQKVPELFNTITLGDMKWEPRLGEWGESFSPELTAGALRWARQQDLTVRGHVMVWPGTNDKWGNLPKHIRAFKDNNPDPKLIQDLILSHIDEVAEDTKGYVDEWDVMNEPRDNHALIDLCGKPAMAEWFKRARARLPGVRLAINEYSILTSLSDSPTLDIYEGYIRDILANGGPVDVIGMQGYFGTLVPTPERMLKTLDRFGALGPEICITEYSMGGDDQDLICDFTRDLITVLYSHEKVRGWVTWHGMDRYINADGSLTKLGQTYADLVLKQWRTNADLATDAAGNCDVRGHLGRYRIEVTQGERKAVQWVTLRHDSLEAIVTLF